MRRYWCALFFVIFFECQAGTAEPEQPLVTPSLYVPESPAIAQAPTGQGQPSPSADQQKTVPDKQPSAPTTPDPFAQAPSAGGEAGSGFNPHMMGDLPSYFVLRPITITGVKTITTFTTRTFQIVGDGLGTIIVPNTVQVPTTVTTNVRVPLPFHGAFKIAENESPMPQDRVFLTYNFFSDLHGTDTGSNIPQSTTQVGSIGGFPTVINTLIPAAPTPRLNLNREVIGFEKTFFRGSASVEVRAPLLQQQSIGGVGGFGAQDFGDMSFIVKYAFFRDRVSGNVLSAGLAVTAPTGPSIVTAAGNIHPVLVQPYVGYVWNFNGLFVQGFTSQVTPTDMRDVALLFNDISINLWAYRAAPSRLLNFVVPVLEAHVTTPLNHRNVNDLITLPDQVVLTGGVHLGLFGRSTLSLGAATPVTGPRLFDVEALAQFNWRF